jgi:hypothetical protein
VSTLLYVCAGGSEVEVTVSCTDFVDDFSVTLLATASSATNCEGSDSATVNVTVNSKPDVSIQPLFNVTTFCSPEGDLSFAYSVSSGPANSDLDLTLTAPEACRLDTFNPGRHSWA